MPWIPGLPVRRDLQPGVVERGVDHDGTRSADTILHGRQRRAVGRSTTGVRVRQVSEPAALTPAHVTQLHLLMPRIGASAFFGA